MSGLQIGEQMVIERADLQQLLDALAARQYRVVGPTVRDAAIVLDAIQSAAELPIGWTDEQDGGKYRLTPRGDDALFGYTAGPQAWKKYLYPAARRLWQAQRNGGEWQFDAESADAPRYAFIGVRACDLHAILIQDRVLQEGVYADADYAARRANAFIVAVNCTRAGGTCFCASMNAGPKATSDFDIALTEILDGARHYFVVEIGSERGAEVLGEVTHHAASAEEINAASRAVAEAAAQMGRTLDTRGIKELLYRNYENPRWDQVAARCLTCANCTMVCPTCFCASVEDVTGLDGTHAERWRKWDSCFTLDFSYIHGGSVRASPKARYRQWMTHKLATWLDQFGASGCVGCGRCITWCPVGIDITEEARAIRDSESPPPPQSTGGGNPVKTEAFNAYP
jgi:sulfhydrogenase subunit beta (sulfur reductase)